jgi:hypothetical protein
VILNYQTGFQLPLSPPMVKAINDIITKTSEAAEVFGIQEEELLSLIIIAKFSTEFSNKSLEVALHNLFIVLIKEETIETLESMGMTLEDKNFYEVVDTIADFHFDGANNLLFNKLYDLLGGSTLQLISACFGKENQY